MELQKKEARDIGKVGGGGYKTYVHHPEYQQFNNNMLTVHRSSAAPQVLTSQDYFLKAAKQL